MTDQEKGDQATRLARVLMRTTEDHTTEPHVAIAALWRCIAGFYARAAVEAGDPPSVAVKAIMRNAIDAGDMAARLLDEMHRVRGEPRHTDRTD